MKALAKLIATFFYVGDLPFIPGTFGSIVGLCIFYSVQDSYLLYLGITILIIILGFLTCTKAEEEFKQKDPRFVVIDEVSGMLVALMFVPFSIGISIIGFFVFRLLDTIKPYPADILQEKKGSIGIMGDDLVAGLYTNIVLQILTRLLL